MRQALGPAAFLDWVTGVLALGDSLLSVGEIHLAVEACFQVVLDALPSPPRPGGEEAKGAASPKSPKLTREEIPTVAAR